MRLVLDTNVVLDWLVFCDPSTRILRDGIRERRIVVLTHAPAIDELRRVLAYAELKLDANKQIDVLAEYRTLASVECITKELSLPTGFPHCRDRDDDHFLEFAYFVHANALVSRDKELLRLHSSVGKFGFKIVDAKVLAAMLEDTSTGQTE